MHVFLHACVCMDGYVYKCMYVKHMLGCMHEYVYVYVLVYYVGKVACYSGTDLFGEIWTRYGRFRVLPVMDLLHW